MKPRTSVALVAAAGVVLATTSALATSTAANAAASSGGRVAVTTAAPASVAALPPAPASGRADFAVQLPLRDQAGAEALALAVSTPGTSSYHHYLTPAQFNARFAPTAAQVGSVEHFLRAGGMSIGAVPGNNRYVEASGSVAQVDALFGVRLRLKSKTAGTLVADRAVTVPRSVAADTLTVTGLDGVLARPGIQGQDGTTSGSSTSAPQAAKRPTINTPCSTFWAQHTATLPTAYGKDGFPTAICGYNNDQLQAAYGVQPMIARGTTGKGVKVAIVDAYNLPTMESDANRYFAGYGEKGFAKGQYNTVLPKRYFNQNACGVADWNSEQALDTETVHGIAPGATIEYVAGRSCSYQGLIDPLNTIVNRHLADIVSNSWGFFGEGTIPTSTITATHEVLVQAGAEGIGMYFCTLDNGDEVATTGSAQAVYPASDPMVTAVGGTSLGIGADGSRVVETGWGSARAGITYDASGNPVGYSPAPPGTFYAGGGGGPSAIFGQPAYQKGVVPSTLSQRYSRRPMRVEPDLSADADPYTGYEIGLTTGGSFQTFSYGGTSLATPLIASLVALSEQGRSSAVGFANPLLYKASTRRTVLDVPATTSPVAMAFTSSLSTSLCYQSCLVSTNFDTSLQTGPGFDDVTGIGAPKGASFVRALHNG